MITELVNFRAMLTGLRYWYELLNEGSSASHLVEYDSAGFPAENPVGIGSYWA